MEGAKQAAHACKRLLGGWISRAEPWGMHSQAELGNEGELQTGLLLPVRIAFFDEGAHAFLCIVAGADGDMEVEGSVEVVGDGTLV